MQMIAHEFNFFETAFLHAQNPAGSFPINVFTPANEMDFAGHPVIGAGHTLFRSLLPDVSPGPGTALTIVTKAGSAPVRWGAHLALQSGDKNGEYRFVLDQGSEIGRDSNMTVDVVLNEHGTAVVSILLSGQAAPVTEGVLSLPE
ncbi:hypothetical protein QQZ08_007797 [Neonectria magnoliae]|uniref:PhzF family phenazine biosynthesis protein n=1 Tax=Neonectria magnoliae TaxID=2732573 RepID=A0ABR1HWY0_9HYPO